MNQLFESVAAIDPRRPREPVTLDHYTLPGLYTQAREHTLTHQLVPVPLTTVAVYYLSRFGRPFMDHWRQHAGPDLYSHALFKVHGMMMRDIAALHGGPSDRALVPLASALPIKVFQSAIAFQDPLSIQVAWEAYDHYRQGVEKFSDLKHLAELLYEPFAMLTHAKDKLTPAALRNYNKLLQYALSRQTVPAQGAAMVIAEHGEDELNHLVLVIPDEHLPDRPSMEGEDDTHIPVEAPQSVQVAEASLLDASDSLDDYIDHVDGSKGLSACKELQEILAPRVAFLPDPDMMYHAVTKDLSGVWAHAAELWWKINGVYNTPNDAAREALALEPTIRLLQRAFTTEQFTAFTEVLPMEELVDWSLQFVVASVDDPPALSWPQIRLSMVSVSMARIAHLAKKPLIDFAVALYEKVGLHEEIQLLHTTLEIMQEGLEDQARQQMQGVLNVARH